MQKLACQYVGCACANSASKNLWLWRPLPLVAPVLVCSDSPRMEAGRADSIKESQLENKPDLPPPSHCLLDEDVVEDLYEQDLPKGHSFTLRTRPHQGTQLSHPMQWLNPPTKEPRTWIRIQCAVHPPKNLGPLDQETKLIPAAEDRTPSNNHT